MMAGHANQDELNMIQALDAKTDLLLSSVDDIVRLGQLYLCPLHDDERAAELFKQVLNREPLHPWAIYWLAYISLWDLMDRESLLTTKAMLESWLSSDAVINFGPEARAAILQRLAQVRDSPELGDLKDSERITLLEESVSLAPNWVINRWYLARAYITVGKVMDAVNQLEKASDNIIAESSNLSLVDKIFESDVTGRVGPYLPKEIERMLKELHDS